MWPALSATRATAATSTLLSLIHIYGNITDKEAYKKALYARAAEGSTYVDNGITVPHAKTNVVTRPSPVSYTHLDVYKRQVWKPKVTSVP